MNETNGSKETKGTNGSTNGSNGQAYMVPPPQSLPPSGIPARVYTGDAVKSAKSASKLIMEHVARAQQFHKLSDAAVARLIGCGQSNISTLHHGSTMSSDTARRLNCVFPFPDADYLVSQLPRDSKPCSGKPTHPSVIDYVDRRAAWDAAHKDVALPRVSSTATEAASVAPAKLVKTTDRTRRQLRKETKRVGALLNTALSARNLSYAEAAKEIGLSYDIVHDCSRIGDGKRGHGGVRSCRMANIIAIESWLALNSMRRLGAKDKADKTPAPLTTKTMTLAEAMPGFTLTSITRSPVDGKYTVRMEATLDEAPTITVTK